MCAKLTKKVLVFEFRFGYINIFKRVISLDIYWENNDLKIKLGLNSLYKTIFLNGIKKSK